MGGVRRRDIRTKISNLLLTVGMLVLGISICISYVGMTKIKQKSVESSKKLGETAASDIKEALIKISNDILITNAEQKASLSNEKLEIIQGNVTLVSDYISDIYQNPNNYGNVSISIPLLENDGILALQFSHMEGITYEQVKQEAEKAGMFYDVAKHVFQINGDSISSIYYGSANGFMISYDKNSGLPYEENAENPSLLKDYSITDKEWYKKAVEEGKVTLIETYYDTFGRLVLSCSAPVWNSNHEPVGVLAMDILIEDINEEIVSSKIGEKGYAILVNEKGQIISGPGLKYDGTQVYFENIANFSQDFAEVFLEMQKEKSGLREIEINQEEYYMAYSPVSVSEWILVTVIPKQEVIQPALDSYSTIKKETNSTAIELKNILKYMAVVYVIACIGLMTAILLLTIRMSDKIAKPIKKLTNDVLRISDGDLEYRTDIKTGDEIELLGDAFNNMTASLKEYIVNYAQISADKEKIATELNVAAAIQRDMLPKGKSVQDRYELFAAMHPAKEVGGDFYDYFITEDGKLWLVIADVSGKGVPASLFMVIAKTLLKNQANYSASPAEVLKNVNNQLCEHNEADMFVTVFIARYDFDAKTFECANAGHNQPLIYRGKSGFQWVETNPGLVLAGFENMEYENFTVSMNCGDRLFLYTDGVTEALNRDEILYGEKRLIEKLNTAELIESRTVGDIVSCIKQDIILFADGAEQADDITIMALEIK